MRKRVDDLFALLSAPSLTSLVPKGYEKAKLEQARDFEPRVSILKDALK
jgi:hypothetical protein